MTQIERAETPAARWGGRPLARAATAGITSMTVVIPARNEEQLLPGTLAALERARRQLWRWGAQRCLDVRSDVVVVLDSCHDRSLDVVRAAGVRPLVVEAGSVGAARAAGCAAAIRDHLRRGTQLSSLWLAMTDADTHVPAHWLTTQWDAAVRGADAVVGTVEPGEGLTASQRAQWYARHTLAEGHPHIHGANLGVRASTYQECGGFAPLANHEDVDLVTRLRGMPAVTVCATDSHRVVTSTRQDSRTVDGFGTYVEDLRREID